MSLHAGVILLLGPAGAARGCGLATWRHPDRQAWRRDAETVSAVLE
jgi:hypothetical protein